MSSCWAHPSFSTSMIKDKGQILQCQTFNSKQPPKSSEKGTLISQSSFLFFFFSCRKYFFLSFFSFSAYICKWTSLSLPHTYFRQLPLFLLFFNHHISKHNHSSTKFQNKGRDKTITTTKKASHNGYKPLSDETNFRGLRRRRLLSIHTTDIPRCILVIETT